MDPIFQYILLWGLLSKNAIRVRFGGPPAEKCSGKRPKSTGRNFVAGPFMHESGKLHWVASRPSSKSTTYSNSTIITHENARRVNVIVIHYRQLLLSRLTNNRCYHELVAVGVSYMQHIVTSLKDRRWSAILSYFEPFINIGFLYAWLSIYNLNV